MGSYNSDIHPAPNLNYNPHIFKAKISHEINPDIFRRAFIESQQINE
jgi:hypothetical protein